MSQKLMLILFCAVMYAGCYQPSTKSKGREKKGQFLYKETIAKGKDTGMIRLGGFKRINIADILCQRWTLANRENITVSDIHDLEMRKSIVRDMVLFKDSTAVLNPMGSIKLGTWQVRTTNELKTLVLKFHDRAEKQYHIEDISSDRMELVLPEKGLFLLRFSAPAQLHKNMVNDPFHPANNQWRVKPVQKESNSAIHARIKNCLLFYALYYRDHIKREAETISFEGLPAIFKWYNGGIGLPDKDELTDSWIECFYNEEQALTGYALLRKLIVDYEFNWPRGAPGWIYRTHAVLEQMYHKVDDVKMN